MLTTIAPTATRIPALETQSPGKPIHVRLRREARLIGLARTLARVLVSARTEWEAWGER